MVWLFWMRFIIFLTHSAVPATVSLTADGRVRLDFVNSRPDEISVLIVARRRAGLPRG